MRRAGPGHTIGTGLTQARLPDTWRLPSFQTATKGKEGTMVDRTDGRGSVVRAGPRPAFRLWAVVATLLAVAAGTITPGVRTARAAGDGSCHINVSTQPASPIPFGTPVNISVFLTGVPADRLQGTVSLDGAAFASLDTQGQSAGTWTFNSLASGDHTVSWACRDVSQGLPPNTDSTTFTINPGPSGVVQPKFVVLSVVYAPPGQQSLVDYGSSTAMGVTTKDTDSFQSTVSQSVKLTAGGSSIGVSTSFSQKQDGSASISVTKSSSFDVIARGPESSADGIDHNFDAFYLWLNPAINVSQTGASSVQWGGFTTDTRDTNLNTPSDTDIVRVTVGQLLHPETIPPGTASAMARTWAGPDQGLTTEDFQTILARDPFASGSTAIDPQRFDPVGGQTFDYSPAPAGGQPGSQKFTLGYQATTDLGKSATDQYTVSFQQTEGASFFNGMLKAEFQQSTTLQWTNTHATDESSTIGQSASFSLTGPATGYQGPTQVEAFKDNVYGTFMFAFTKAPTFELSATNSPQTVTAGGSASFNLASSSDFGFTGNLTFDPNVVGLPAGATATINPALVAVGGSTTVTVSTDVAKTPPGSFQLTITANSGIIFRHVIVTLVVNPTPFTMTVTPSSRTITPGQSTTYTVTTTAGTGFNGQIGLKVVGLPPNSTATFDPVTITGSGTSTLTVTTTSSTPASTSTLLVSGTGGGTTQTAQVQLIVNNAADFTLSVSPQAAGVAAGGTAKYTVTIGAINGFNGSVNLALDGLPPNATFSFTPNPVVGAGTSTLSVVTTTSTPPNNYDLKVTGTSGSLPPKSQTVTLTVSNFTVAATPSAQTVSAGGGASYSISTGAVNGFNDPVSFNVTGLPANASASYPGSVNGAATATLAVSTAATTPPGTYTLTVKATSGALEHDANVTFTVNPPSQPDFALAVTPGAQTATGGQTVSYSVSTSALNGFKGNIGLRLTGLPANATASLAPSSVAAGSGSTLSISVPSTTPAGTYGLSVIGTSGKVTHSAGISLTVQASFSLWTDSTGYVVSAGDPNGTSGIVESFALNGFSGTVALSASGQPAGVDAGITPSSIDANGSATLTLIASADTQVGNYDVTITGTSGGLTETFSFTLTVCDISGICPAFPAGQVGSTRRVARVADANVPQRRLG
jgi:hypothetical protein